MKREQRTPWLAAAGRHWVLCSFCRHGEDDEEGIYCEHPIAAVVTEGMEPGMDCSGFRPEKGLTLEAAAACVAEWDAEERAEDDARVMARLAVE